jgi:hypothetical protein
MLAYLVLFAALAVRILSGVGVFGTMGFSPLGAALLFFGSRMSRKHYPVALAAMIATDIYITNHHYGMPVAWDQGFIWAWYIGIFFLGSLLKNRVKPLNVFGASLGASLSFYVVADFGVWLTGILYPHTWAGFVACYVAAMPFLQRGIISDLLFSTVIFGIPALIAYMTRETAQDRVAG